jgi:hypothetical protein
MNCWPNDGNGNKGDKNFKSPIKSRQRWHQTSLQLSTNRALEAVSRYSKISLTRTFIDSQKERPNFATFFYSFYSHSPILSPRSVKTGAIRPSTCRQTSSLSKNFPISQRGSNVPWPPKIRHWILPFLSSPPLPLPLPLLSRFNPPDGLDVQSATGVGAYSRRVQPP